MACGLAEEETRLVTSRAAVERRGLALCHRVFLPEPRGRSQKPRIRIRPQTACGRTCSVGTNRAPFRGRSPDRPQSKGLKAKPVPRRGFHAELTKPPLV